MAHEVPSFTAAYDTYNCHMEEKENNIPPELEQYLTLCKRQYERMERDGTWPWPDWDEQPDSHESSDMVDSKDNPENI